MGGAETFALLRSDLNGFLFAEVGIERSGLRLSVLSVLARLDLDPWQEAGRLAGLPRKAAIDGLAQSISVMPASAWGRAEAAAIATRLVALLPVGTVSPAAAARSHIRPVLLIVLFVMAAWMAGAGANLLTSAHQDKAVSAPAAPMASPHEP
jgi:hypothetical protein